MALIYGLSSSRAIENIRYVGKTNNLTKRLKRHLSDYYLNADTYKNRWIKKELSEGFEIKIILLEKVSDLEWEQCEKRWIKKLKSEGYVLTNGTIGGEGIILESNEVIKKRNKTRIQKNLQSKKEEIKKFKIREENGKWFAKRRCVECDKTLQHSAKNFSAIIHLMRKSEFKKCLVCRSKSRKLTEEEKIKISLSKQNLSQETRDKLSKIHKGKKVSKKTRDKLRKANLGKTLSEETKNKIRLSRLGKKLK